MAVILPIVCTVQITDMFIYTHRISIRLVTVRCGSSGIQIVELMENIRFRIKLISCFVLCIILFRFRVVGALCAVPGATCTQEHNTVVHYCIGICIIAGKFSHTAHYIAYHQRYGNINIAVGYNRTCAVKEGNGFAHIIPIEYFITLIVGHIVNSIVRGVSAGMNCIRM